MQRNDTEERQQKHRDDCIRGLAGCKKKHQQIKKALEGERRRRMAMADRGSVISQLELTAQMVAARLRVCDIGPRWGVGVSGPDRWRSVSKQQFSHCPYVSMAQIWLHHL